MKEYEKDRTGMDGSIEEHTSRSREEHRSEPRPRFRGEMTAGQRQQGQNARLRDGRPMEKSRPARQGNGRPAENARPVFTRERARQLDERTVSGARRRSAGAGESGSRPRTGVEESGSRLRAGVGELGGRPRTAGEAGGRSRATGLGELGGRPRTGVREHGTRTGTGRQRYRAPESRRGYGDDRRQETTRRRKKRRRQRLALLCVILAALFIVGGAVFGLLRWKSMKERRAFAEQGVAAASSGDYEAAIADFDAALEKAGGRIGGFETNVLLNRAEAEYKQQDYAAALKSYQLLLEDDPENETAKKGAVLCLVETGAYDQALALNVLQSQVYNRMAVDQIKAGAYDKAMEYITQGRGFADGTAARDLDFNEMVVWEKRMDFQKALELLEAYVQKYGSDERIERELAFLRSRQGNSPEGETQAAQ